MLQFLFSNISYTFDLNGNLLEMELEVFQGYNNYSSALTADTYDFTFNGSVILPEN